MGKLYLDLDFTNGNYYLTDILEIALVSEESGYAFHSIVKIQYSMPKRVRELMNITDKTLATIGRNFMHMIISLIEFIHNEQLQSQRDPIIIAHGGFLHDFPNLLANCMKHNFDDFGILKDCLFVDSLRMFENDGYRRLPD